MKVCLEVDLKFCGLSFKDDLLKALMDLLGGLGSLGGLSEPVPGQESWCFNIFNFTSYKTSGCFQFSMKQKEFLLFEPHYVYY